MALTTVSDTLYRPDGTLVNGAILLAWPTFYASDGHLVQAGSFSITITNGVLSVQLEPTATAVPTGTVYKATYEITGAPSVQEIWAVPTSVSAVPLASVRVLNPPVQGPYVPNIFQNSYSFAFSNASALISTAFNFAPQSPSGSLTASVPATITLSPVPQGVNGTDQNHYLYVSGGTGTAEIVLITGGTAIGGASSGTITFTPANNHSGAWTIASATAGLQEAVQSIALAGVPVRIIIPAGNYTVYASINLLGLSNLDIDGYGATLFLNSPTNQTINVIQSFGAGIVSSTTVTVNVNFPNRELTVANSITVASTTGLNPGDYLMLTGTENGRAFGQTTRIASIVGSVVTTYEPVVIPIQTTDANSVSKVTMGNRLSIRGLSFDGTNAVASGTYQAIAVNFYAESGYRDINIYGFNAGSSSGGVNNTVGYRNVYDNFRIDLSGSAGVAAFMFWRHSNSAISNILIERAPFGFQPVIGTTLHCVNIVSMNSSGRAIKISGVAHCRFANITGYGGTGLAVMTGSYNNLLVNCGGNNVATSDEDNRSNSFVNVNAPQLGTGLTDSKNVFSQITSLSPVTFIDAGANAIFEWADPVVAATALAMVATANSRFAVITTDALTTAAGASATLAIGNIRVALQKVIITASVANGTNTQGIPTIATVINNGFGSILVTIHNAHATQAFNGTLIVSVAVR